LIDPLVSAQAEVLALSDQFVIYKQSAGIAYITLNRPEVHNAVHDEMREQLNSALEQFDFDSEALVAIVHGNGASFCAGADVKLRFHNRDDLDQRRRFTKSNPAGVLGHTAYWKPVIAAVHGYCLGFGINFALECD
jgi:enoyl-CoA hydratase/carnithine racemase